MNKNKDKNEIKKLKLELEVLKQHIEDLENRIKAMEGTGLVMNPTPEYHPF